MAEIDINQRSACTGGLHVLLPTLGSMGDVLPVVALGMALKKRSHRPTVITNELFSDTIRSAGLDFIALGTAAEARETIADPRLWHPTKGLQCIAERLIVPNIPRLYDILAHQSSPNAVVAASGLCLGARVAQEKLGVRLATIHLQPSVLRSLVDSGRYGLIPMGPRVPRAVKKALFWLFDHVFIDKHILPGLNTFRAQLGLAPVQRVFQTYLHSPQLVIGLFPEWFAPPQPDWPPNTQLAGFVLPDGGEDFEIPAEADQFLSAGPRPVIFTAGSAAATLERFFRESVEACRIGGFRALLVTTYMDQLPAVLPSDVRAFSYLPFSRVLPRCAALVHHGGIGTLAQAIKAQLPQVVVPNSHDQPDNGYRVEHLGLGYRIQPGRYHARYVASRLAELMVSAEIRQRCRDFAARIDSDAALGHACSWIEQLAQHPN
jgi:rhamnosyltransferase subunit B